MPSTVSRLELARTLTDLIYQLRQPPSEISTTPQHIQTQSNPTSSSIPSHRFRSNLRTLNKEPGPTQGWTLFQIYCSLTSYKSQAIPVRCFGSLGLHVWILCIWVQVQHCPTLSGGWYDRCTDYGIGIGIWNFGAVSWDYARRPDCQKQGSGYDLVC